MGITGEKCPKIQWQVANQSALYIVYKHKPYNNVPYETFNKLFTGVFIYISDQTAAVFAFAKYAGEKLIGSKTLQI